MDCVFHAFLIGIRVPMINSCIVFFYRIPHSCVQGEQIMTKPKAPKEAAVKTPAKKPSPVKAKPSTPLTVKSTKKKPEAPSLSTINQNMLEARKTTAKAFKESMIDFSKPLKDKS